MRLIWRLLPLLVFLAPAVAAVDNPERGEKLFVACAACHGVEGQGNASLNAPRLTHLAPVYVASQLQKFKSGLRGGSNASDSARQMAAMAATVQSDQDMYDIAAYLATLGGGVSAVSIEADGAVGASYYQQFCAACHGPAAEGNLALNSPRLAGADDWYLMSQLRAFRSGVRGSLAEDRTGRQMRAMAGVLPDDEAVAAVVAYIRSLEQ